MHARQGKPKGEQRTHNHVQWTDSPVQQARRVSICLKMFLLLLLGFFLTWSSTWILMEISSFHILYWSYLQQLIEKRREKRVAALVRQDNEVIVKLENVAIEHSKSVDSAVLGKYNIWRKEIDNENADSTVRLMRDQIIMARVYLSIAKMKNKHELYVELQSRLKESQHALGEATSDADLHHRY